MILHEGSNENSARDLCSNDIQALPFFYGDTWI
jgi:hypothetical protein